MSFHGWLGHAEQYIYLYLFPFFFSLSLSLSLSLLSVKRAIASRGDVYTYSGVCGGGDDYLVASSFRWNKEKRTHTHGPKGHQATAKTIIITAKGESESESSNTHTHDIITNPTSYLIRHEKVLLNKKKTLFSSLDKAKGWRETHRGGNDHFLSSPVCFKWNNKKIWFDLIWPFLFFFLEL